MEWATIQVDEYTIWLYYFHKFPRQLLTEAQSKGQPLVGPYSFIKHPPHIPDGDYHFHLYCKKNQIFALNRGGTAHDKSHSVRIPNNVADALRTKFPKWKIPDNNLIESTSVDLTAILIEIYFLL